MDQTASILNNGIKTLGLSLPVDKCLCYLQLLSRWNRAYNLTAIRDINEMATRHILDSLAIFSWVKGPHVIDVGSGAGFPGIPLALAAPDWQVVLLDSNGKKIRFLEEVKRVLSLENVTIVHDRVEHYHPTMAFDTIVTRAFSQLDQMIQWTHHLIAPKGIWLAMKGRYPDTELAAINRSYRVQTYDVSGEETERCCVIIES